MTARRPRLAIFVIAYYAESTLRQVLERIPREVFELADCHVLVVDDASRDRTYEIGRAYQAERPDVPLTVLRNQYNQGYGGNQKVGYAWAEAEGFDLVAMLHGDGQYAPEALPALLAPLLEGRADAVFGSRMLTPLGALRGGMPLYKFVGNRILSGFQNALLRARLSEFHSGYRIYAVRALAAIPYRLNTNDFHFDTEIIVQLLQAGLRIAELPIPTYYGGEICRVNGLRYAKDVARVTVAAFLHRLGLRYQRRFDPVPMANRHYALKLGFASSHRWALEAVPPGSAVVDLGAGPVGLAGELVARGCRVTVVDQHRPAAPAPGVEVVLQDLDAPPAYDAAGADVILMLDVIEHLRFPELFLERLRAQLDHRPRRLVLSTPNVAFFVVRLMLLLGQFNYGRAGILDRTHTRLFTRRTLLALLADAGFRVRRIRGVPAPFPLVLGGGRLGRAALAVNLALIRILPRLFAYQFLVEADSTPDVDFVLRDTRETSRRAAAGGDGG